MEQQQTILEGYSDLEKGAYLGAIASIATADRSASEEEMEYIDALCASASLSEPQTEMIRRSATELTGAELNKCLDVLKTSDLRFSLITDLIAFAESDKDYSEAEKKSIASIASYLGVNQEQFSLLDQFTHQAKEEGVAPEEAASPNFLAGSGLGDKMKSAGINTGGLLKGLIGVMGPIVLAGMLSGGRRRGGGLLGGLLGGGMLGGGLGGMMGGGGLGGMLGGGGLGSLTGMLGGGGGFRRSGGMLGRMFGM
ncbi:MAG: hypothetical protein JWP27_1233 [Flaviaesturariibacter sp.]|nr:hypothetical protein [Flaviaesturariibacter sp.]